MWGSNSYPGAAAPRNGIWDRYLYAWDQCCSYINEQLIDNGIHGPVRFYNARDWANKARAAGIAVDGTPRPGPGEVIQLNPGVQGTGPWGHVGCVISSHNGWLWVADYNWVGPYRYGTHWLSPSGANFLHFRQPAPPVPTPIPQPSTGANPWPPGTKQAFFSGWCMVSANAQARIRNGPGTQYRIMRQIPRGVWLHFDGWIAIGPGIPDMQTGQLDNRWFHVAPSSRQSDPEWVASALIKGEPQ